MTVIRTVAFDARYINDRYHGIGRHAYNLLDALTRLDPGRRYLAYYHPGYQNTRFDMEMLRERSNVELRPIRLAVSPGSVQPLGGQWAKIVNNIVRCPIASRTHCLFEPF